MRGVFPLDGFHVSSRLARFIRANPFEVRVDHDFDAVIEACAAPAEGRRQTWINSTIRELYGALFQRGFCHTIECYQGDELVGGLYGISLGGAFFGESMFHRVTDASKVALAHLVARLIRGGYALLDTQFVTPHLATLGAVEWPKTLYRQKLEAALDREASLDRSLTLSGEEVLSIIRAAQRRDP